MSRATLCKLSIIYMYLPIALMIVGWCSFWFFIPATQILVWVVFNTLEKQQSKESITFKKWEILLGLVLLILAVYYSGWGGLVPQSSDWPKHNAVLRDLMVRTWPVIYHNHDMVSMLTYYLGQYIVPAAVGKLLLLLFPQAITLETAFVVSEVVMALWNMIGLALVICHLFHLVGHGSFKILVMAAFLFFGNPLVLGKLLYMGMGFSSDLNNYHWLTYDYLMAQYSTNFVLMRWTFPQCIVPWIVMAMLMEGDNDVDSYVVIGLPVILFATFPFLAIVIYMIVLAVKKFLSQNDKKAFLLKCFSKENLLCFLSLGTFSFCYYISYFLTKGKPESLKLSFVFSWSRQFLVTYGVFVVFTFGLYAILLLKYEKKNLFLNSSIVILLVLPLFQFGVWNDFVMRVSIPSLFVICVLTLKRIFEASFKHKGYKLALLAVYLCGMYYPVRELTDVVRQDTIILWQEPFDSYYTLELFANPKARELDEYLSGYGDDVIWNYFTYDAKDSFFLKTIGKKIP